MKVILEGNIMNETILNYIVQAILGGASGYITNDYAINMLFKEYTPLKIGGVIKKTRAEFIDNLSSMVENDIISKEKLQSILNDESFKKEFEDLTADFYENCLYEAAGSSTFAEIDGYDSTIESIDIFVAEIINEHLPDILKIILDNVDIHVFLSPEQLNNISGSIYSVLTDIFNNTDLFETMFLSAYESNKKLVPSNILNKDIYGTVIYNAINILAKAVPDASNAEIDEILVSTGIISSLNASKQIFFGRKVKDVINLESDILKSINNSLLTHINSEKGINYINSLINSLFSYGRECNKSIFQLLDLTFEENLKQYLLKNIPSVTESVVNWISENSHLIDYLIEESIDEVIKESDGLKARLLSTIKNTYLKDLGKKYSIADKIISYVNKLAEPEKLSQNISAKLIEILDSLTVREIVAEAEINNITSENTGKFIINFINKNSESILGKLTDYISDMELKQIIPEELISEKLKLNLIDKLKKLSKSDEFKDYLTDKSVKYADRILSEELYCLINKENAKFFALKIKDLIRMKIASNKDSIKKWIEKEINTAAEEYSSKELSTNTLDLLSDELYKKYKRKADTLKSIPISTALDKLNSVENLTENSAESLRAYTANNTDVILSGSVKAIVTDNLGKLSDDELVSFANDFIGRELKPIMYFGGILGAAAGIILAAFQHSPLDPAEINIANMAVYSFVGYITNVVAINMIFKPYKEKKFLSKIPLLRNFSLGYIVKNQKIFAENTANFIDSSLLSKNSINELFEKYINKIKNSFTDSIAENDYRTLSDLLANNKHSVVKGIFSYLKSQLSGNINHVCSFLYSKINSVKISSLMNGKVIDKMSSLLKDKLEGYDYGQSVNSLINSENTLESKISDNVLKKYVSDIQGDYYDKLSRVLSNENEIKNKILKFENIYHNLVNKQINEFIDSEKQTMLAQSAAEKISGIILSKDSRDKIIQKALCIINKSLDRNKTFEEAFDGKLKNYVDSHMPYILENVSEAVKNNIKESKSKIAVMVQSEVKNNLGFLEKGMYSLMGGDEIVNELLNKIITVKLPHFIDDKKQELNNIAGQLLEEKFYKAKVEVLYTGVNKLQLNEMVDNYLNQENSMKIESRISSLTRDLLLRGGNLKLDGILTLFNANDLSRLLKVYENEINAFTNELDLNLRNNKIRIIDKITEYSYSLIDEVMKSRFKDLFADISSEDISCAIDKAKAELNTNHIDRIIYSSIIDSKNYLYINAGELVNKEEFIKSAGYYFSALSDNQEFEKNVKNHFETIIEEAVSVNFSFVDDETKKYILNIFTDSSINSLKRNLDELLRAIEFDVIAREEIEKMEPEKIHEMFDSFGGKYFKRLMLYGFGGFIFGINMYIGMSLTLLKIISEALNKGKLKQ